jgi:hypothetical protein
LVPKERCVGVTVIGILNRRTAALVPRSDMLTRESGHRIMSADSDSRIAWHRVQLRKNREALKALETARFTAGEIAGPKRTSSLTSAELKQKIAESERCIAVHDRQARRPMATDFGSLAGVNWSTWNDRGGSR